MYLTLSEVFWQSYCDCLSPRISPAELSDLWARGIQHFAGCAWARIDGRSPVDYLTDAAHRDLIRSLAREVFEKQPRDWPEVVALCMARFGDS